MKERKDLNKLSAVLKKIKNPLRKTSTPPGGETKGHAVHIEPHIEQTKEKGKTATHVGVHADKSIMHGKAKAGVNIGLHGSGGHWSPSFSVGVKIPIKGKKKKT